MLGPSSSQFDPTATLPRPTGPQQTKAQSGRFAKGHDRNPFGTDGLLPNKGIQTPICITLLKATIAQFRLICAPLDESTCRHVPK
jgi:hypothetical protein